MQLSTNILELLFPIGINSNHLLCQKSINSSSVNKTKGVATMTQTRNGLVSVLPCDSILLQSKNGAENPLYELDNKIIGLYFAASSSLVCQKFTPVLIETYKELLALKDNFEIIFVSSDGDEESFREHFSTMPWLAIPYSNEAARDHLKNLYSADGRETPRLIILSEKGEVLNGIGEFLVYEFGSLAYPFTLQRIEQLRDEQEITKKNQNLQSVLGTTSRDFLISNDFNQVVHVFQNYYCFGESKREIGINSVQLI